ncbi:MULTISPECIES: acetyl-CoA carboxylase biotin carboxylase subunit [Desulfococcus]|jgi:propionyl-CoA carboxylase alpha chain|uniref:Carbamoyl-phosphate synthase L chain ATP-binding protein n=1 Tax=Desulfococcus multivorans DSM 2059 TaxID=1121405 RepID=S7TQA7_DESML|nr:acetyl-CoA carboxylase biotin carboxylase subunit [Desulfococcus multivorans]AOY57746.1 AccA: propionyl-CoA carboxylase, subunit alpha [Desulfococcus multivorans]AQV00136.1 acetyl/propionyl-CoA carboxylase subunit alpha [Desulfococcus multivorans]EPR38830.1 Carbamoyl-phosphate synthase L chain ATP-binding protein [Desulfococcus multivorans DSM 2059]MDX9819141.1 acetyl-CoA carboxylase biotin carboxylase subunit [Desulfococcus multivorans]SJZ80520.1 propionyl-CoA carboxylase alpha chain [Desu
MFEKILIANRGEIAVRIIRTCRKLGIGTVAVYSDADSRSLHVQTADEAVHIGKPHAQMSYLNADKIISVAQAAGCQAVHPGYGFLSENPAFAQSVMEAGLVFIGPPAAVIAAMGDKIAAKALAVKAGVPIIPGHADALDTEDDALAAADAVGYPILLKPAAGGGGKGMRIVRKPEEMKAAFSAGRQETLKSFGDSRIFLERYIEKPRHVEIQILADAFGGVVHLGERECSIQRRYQKIIEESPSPAVSEALRRHMGQAACDLARQAGYVNAGTVEFVLDEHDEFYFLEMNTRLQVEHPVTEMVTGLDLVALQMEIAAGERLPFDQEGITFTGWAMEARICAEDPDRGFIPSTGMITRYAEPRGSAVRVDSGVQTGSYIGVYYDSMMAKAICCGNDREEARIRLVEALNGYHIEGVVTNIDFVNSILCHPAFVRGNLATDFIDRHFEGSRPKISEDRRALELAALTAALIYHVRTVAVRDSLRPMVSRIGGKKAVESAHRYTVRSGNEVMDILLEGVTAGRHWTVHVGSTVYAVETPEFEFYRRRLNLTIDGRIHRFRLRVEQSFIHVAFSGITRVFEIYTPREWDLMKYMPTRIERPADNVLVCPMPGLVVGIPVQPGDRVFRGQSLVVLESMKMESDVASPVDGIVSEVVSAVGQAVEAGDVLIRFQA